jgi:hypothetical protein
MGLLKAQLALDEARQVHDFSFCFGFGRVLEPHAIMDYDNRRFGIGLHVEGGN